MKNPANVPGAIPLSALPDHPAVRYFPQSATLAAAAGAAGAQSQRCQRRPLLLTASCANGSDSPRVTPLRARPPEFAEAGGSACVQARTAPGEFPNNKYSAVPTLTKAARIASGETGGIGTEADARKRMMVVPKCHVLDITTETQMTTGCAPPVFGYRTRPEQKS